MQWAIFILIEQKSMIHGLNRSETPSEPTVYLIDLIIHKHKFYIIENMLRPLSFDAMAFLCGRHLILQVDAVWY